MAKRGKKTLFRENMIQEGYKLGALGLTMTEIGNIWGVTERCLYRWANRYPEFGQAIKRGKEEADVMVVQALLQQAKKGNITGIIFWLKNRQPDRWRDRQQIEHLGEIKSAEIKIFNVINNKSEEEINELITGNGRRVNT